MPQLSAPHRFARYRPLLAQVLIFVLLAGDLELFCWYRLRAERHETAAAIAVSDPLLDWRMRTDNNPELNDDGLRNPALPSPHSQPLTRILCLGGSVTYGLGLQRHDTYEVRLQALLHDRSSEPVEVINGGVQGYDTFQVTALLLDLAPRYEPDVVTALVGFNDQPSLRDYRAEGPTPEQVAGRNRQVSTVTRTFLYRSATYRYLRHHLRPDEPSPSSSPAPRPGFSRTAWLARSADNVRYVNEYLKPRGKRFLLMFEARRPAAWLQQSLPSYALPGRDAESTRLMRESYAKLSRDEGIPFIDFQEVFEASGKSQDALFQARDPVHPTPFGNRLIAEAMARKLWDLGWVKRAP